MPKIIGKNSKYYIALFTLMVSCDIFSKQENFQLHPQFTTNAFLLEAKNLDADKRTRFNSTFDYSFHQFFENSAVNFSQLTSMSLDSVMLAPTDGKTSLTPLKELDVSMAYQLNNAQQIQKIATGTIFTKLPKVLNSENINLETLKAISEDKKIFLDLKFLFEDDKFEDTRARLIFYCTVKGNFP